MEGGERLLLVLRALNQSAPCSVLDLYRATKISRPAIYRAIGTLSRYGYVKRIPKQSRFRLTSEVRTLSEGFRDDDWVVEAAAPLIAEVQQKVVWPTSLTTFDRGAMVIRETTRHRSPFVFDSGTVGVRLPMLRSSMGLSYLAFCAPEKRRIILDMLRQSNDKIDAVALDVKETDRLLKNTLRRGYGIRQGGIVTKTSSISVPLMVRNDAVGAICVTFASSAVPLKQSIATFLPALRDAARQIESKAGENL